jgi:anti-sigma regulatory factor (Ser/Thr protein kinase)
VCWQGSRRYRCDRSAPRQARGFAAEHLREVLGDGDAAADVVDDAGLVISELVTNALNAGCTDIVLAVNVHRDHLQLGVRDDGPGLPQPRRPSTDDPRGRGLQIVERLSRSWDVQTHEPHGKTVSATLPVHTHLTAGLPCTVSSLA